ncbi:ATP-dependent RNA helicase HrpB, partial [Durusdinium trenchii]
NRFRWEDDEPKNVSHWSNVTVPVASDAEVEASDDATAWYRCVVRVPLEWKGRAVELHLPKVGPNVRAWWNGEPVAATGTSGQYTIPSASTNWEDANLLVVSLEGATLAATPLVLAGTEGLPLRGRWQHRVGRDEAWAAMPLPAKFGTTTDVVFMAGLPRFVATPLTKPHEFTGGIEGPACDADGNIYAVNFARKGTVGRVRPDGATELFVTLPEGSTGNGIRFNMAGHFFVADYTGHNVLEVDPQTREISVLAHEDEMNQPNDLAIAPDGTLYASDPNWGAGTGQIWRIDPDGTITRLASDMGTTNGIEVSPDGKTLYVNESVQRNVWAFTLTNDRTLKDKRLVRQFSDFGFDGMRCDVDGNLYITRHGKGTVVKLSPEGEILQEIDVLGSKPSNICFGGPDRLTAYVTEMEYGRLVQFRVDRPLLSVTPLPIDDVLPEILTALQDEGAFVLRAPTGAGKTTRVPPAILDAGLAGDGAIVMLEPRRLAARTAARRMARERGSAVGGEVGYQVRFDSKASRETRILVVTEGVLLRRLQEDPFLEGIAVLLFDEFHERNLYSDLALGMARRVRETVRPDLKIGVMSATLDPKPVADYLEKAAIVESLGRTFPVEIEYALPREKKSLPDLAAWGVERMLSRSEGDVLVFLPGVGEIRRADRALEGTARRENLEILTLYGDLPAEEQDRVLAPLDRTKVILSTNVAETSVTIEGVTTVVDTGMARVMRFEPEAGLDRLQLEPISQASADQRTGRAGRSQPGLCLRLWDAAAQRVRPSFETPEIQRVDLTGPVLQLKSWGEQEILAFPWFESPREEAVAQAEQLLAQLGAVDSSGEVTELGHAMARLPVHPRIARLLLAGQEFGHPRAAAWAAALLSERDPFFVSDRRPPMRRGKGTASPAHASRSDVLDRLLALDEIERSHVTDFPWGTVNRSAARFISRARDQLVRLVSNGAATNPGEEMDVETALLRALVLAFPDRVARRRDPRSDKAIMVGGKGVRLAPQSTVRDGELFLCVDVAARSGDALVRMASAVEAEWLPATARRQDVEVFFHPSQKQVVARRRDYYFDLILSEAPTALPEGDAPAKLLFEHAVRNWQQVFPAKDDDLTSYLERGRCLAEWAPELDLPPLDEEFVHGVLRQLCDQCRSFNELKQADWLAAVRNALTWDQQQRMEQLAPQRLQVPSGSQIRLTYEVGRPPVLAVRIQEIFGLRETPRVVTVDLESFWANTYPVVKKELARRYPKHPWFSIQAQAKGAEMRSRLRMAGRVVLVLALQWGAAVPVSSGADWITSPQLCRGTAYSETARRAMWQFDREQGVSLATPAHAPISTSRVPRLGADFVVKLRLRLSRGSRCQLRIGDVTCGLSDLESRTRFVAVAKEAMVGDCDIDSQDWTLLTIRRREGRLSAELNAQRPLNLGQQRSAIEEITLRSSRGEIAVSHFVVTGDLLR